MSYRPRNARRLFATRRLLTAALIAPLSLATANAYAEVTTTGSVSPNTLFLTAQDDLFVGQSGGGSGPAGTLDITNGSVLASNRLFILQNGSRVTVTGAGSQMFVFDQLRLGSRGPVTLEVLDGGALTSGGTTFEGDGPFTGFVTVDGAGSVWTNQGDMAFGGLTRFATRDGFLTIRNGGVVNNAGGVLLGPLASHTSRITFDNGTLNTDWGLAPVHALRGTGTINADHWLLYGDHTISSAADLPSAFTLDQLPDQNIALNLAWTTPLDALHVFGTDQGTLVLNNGIDVMSDSGYVQYSVANPSATMTIDGPGTTWTVRNTLDVGLRGQGELRIINGGRVVMDNAGPGINFDRDLTLGEDATGVGRLLVQGAGSRLDINAVLELGDQGQGHLVVNQGGRVDASALNVTSGSLHLSDAGSLITLSHGFNVDQPDSTGPDPTPAVLIENGARVESVFLTLQGASGLPATALLTGAGTSWTNTDRVVVGNNGGTGVLRIEDGATLDADRVSIGLNNNGTPPSSIVVTGAGSRLTATGDFYIGHDGTGTLTIADGGLVEMLSGPFVNDSNNDNFGLGAPIILDNGTLTVAPFAFYFAEDVTGVGTINANAWLLDGNHTINSFADLPSQISVNQLPGQDLTVNLAWVRSQGIDFRHFGINDGVATLGAGMDFRARDGYLGYFAGTTGDLTLSGAGTHWRADDLTVGRAGDGTLRVENGASLGSERAVLGEMAGTSGSVIISGPGSSWAPDTNLNPTVTIGEHGTGLLRIEGGATFGPGNILLARRDGAVGELIITGSGTTVTSTRDLIIGASDIDSLGTVRILDGAQATFRQFSLTSDEPATSQLLIDGAGTTVTFTGVVATAEIDTDWLRVSDGASLMSAGEHRVFGGVEIDGAGASWVIDGPLFLGDRHPATLEITDGATFTTGDAAVGQNRLGASDARADVLVDGAGSLWTVAGNITLGGTTRDNIPLPGEYRGTLTISDGAAVTASGALLIDTGPSGSFVQFDNGTLNVESALALPDNLRGTGTINADYWLISGDFTLNDFSSLPNQIVYDQLPGQDITVNLAWSDPTSNLAFFGVDDGTVTVGSGLSIDSSAGYVALTPGAVGSLTVDGAGTAWDVSQDMRVGVAGDGTLRVQAGGQVEADRFIVGELAGGVGLLEIVGPGTTAIGDELFLGRFGDGALRVADGASVTIFSTPNQHFGYLGEHAGSSGTAIVTGAGSVLDLSVRNVTFGVDGQALLRVEDGAVVTTSMLLVGANSFSEGRIVVDDATWTTEFVRFGFNGTGIIELRNGATANNETVVLGSQDGIVVEGVPVRGAGIATVEGAGTVWNITQGLGLGQDGDGTLVLSDGARINSAFTSISNFRQSFGRATLRGDATVWDNANNFSIFEHGELRIEDGATLTIGGSMLLRGLGTVTFVIGDAAPTPITIAQDADLVGRIEIELAPDAAPELGDLLLLFDIGGARTNVFNNAREDYILATTEDGIDLVITYEAGDGNDIGLTTALAGDLDGDALVGAADLDIILANWGAFVGAYQRADGDVSGNGVVNQEDLQVVLDHWGNAAPPSPTIPEPSSLMLLGMGGLALLRRRQ